MSQHSRWSLCNCDYCNSIYSKIYYNTIHPPKHEVLRPRIRTRGTEEHRETLEDDESVHSHTGPSQDRQDDADDQRCRGDEVRVPVHIQEERDGAVQRPDERGPRIRHRHTREDGDLRGAVQGPDAVLGPRPHNRDDRRVPEPGERG